MSLNVNIVTQFYESYTMKLTVLSSSSPAQRSCGRKQKTNMRWHGFVCQVSSPNWQVDDNRLNLRSTRADKLVQWLRRRLDLKYQ